jgi:hypothetical protein
MRKMWCLLILAFLVAAWPANRGQAVDTDGSRQVRGPEIDPHGLQLARGPEIDPHGRA